MTWRPHGRAEVDPESPRAFAICDRCGCLTNLNRLQWQYQFSGVGLINLRLLVCETCLDIPQPQLQAVIIPADPEPVFNARPEPYMLDEVDYLSTQDNVPITTQDDVILVPDQASQNYSDIPPDPNNGVGPPNSNS